ncbi:MAG: flagellar basal-body rod protein FlgF [Cereibacter sphaeroides]|uniref:Flagellar basal-body rod protein FlgF n=1 Tax=Cereibacter sphaeroides TaxID=1063 RepID=A0A2W5TPD4_CERSP|nr:MAG: flagellar basal-body rod protein FlgF [Cereibacter sphaeroides]
MDASGYVTLTRQSGLMREMQVVAQNIANASTSGFRREGVVFSEFVKKLPDAPSLSMANASARHIDLSQGGLTQTGGTFDFAIQGEGFFLVETPQGQRLTRAGSFTPGAGGELQTPDGYRLLDEGGTPVFVPPDARKVTLGRDGTLTADGVALARVGLWQPRDPLQLGHEAGVLFNSGGGVDPMEEGLVLQGFVEEANVNPVAEVSRMIEVQRAYEMGQNLLDREDERIRAVIRTLGR